MNPGEHALMARVEDRHWWYLGLRDAIARTLDRPEMGFARGRRILDAGCGTGANLRMLAERFRPSYLAGFDLSPEAVDLARAKAPTAHVEVGDITRPDLVEGDLDLVVSLDVLSIPGFERAFDGMRALAGALRPGGLIVWNLPAYPWLYSAHDVAVHTTERYTTAGLRPVLERLGLAPVRLTYRLCLPFPLVVAARLPSILGPRPTRGAARSDLYRLPGERVNRVLFAMLRAENRLIARGTRLPWGSSVFAVARKAG